MNIKLTSMEKKWVLYDVGNSAFTMLTATILPKLDGTATIQSGAWVGIPNP